MNGMNQLRILAFGASLTEGYHSNGNSFHPYTIRLTELLLPSYEKVEIVNAGVSGEAVLSTTMLPRLKKILSSTISKFDWVLILAGTNDTVRDQQKASTIFEQYKLLVNECHKHGSRVLCMTLPETIYPTDTAYDVQRKDFNRLIREKLLAQSTNDNIVILDVDQLLPQHSILQEQHSKIWDDEVHLKPYGYDQLGQFIYERLKPFLFEQK